MAANVNSGKTVMASSLFFLNFPISDQTLDYIDNFSRIAIVALCTIIIPKNTTQRHYTLNERFVFEEILICDRFLNRKVGLETDPSSRYLVFYKP